MTGVGVVLALLKKRPARVAVSERAAPDPASFVLEHGPEAMAAVIASALPLRAHLAARVLVHGDCTAAPDVLRRTEPVSVPDVLLAAAVLIKAAHRARVGAREEQDERDAPAQRAALSAAAHGLVPLAELQAVPPDAITTAGRLLAWCAAVRTVRILGSAARPAHVWRSLGAMPLPLLSRDAAIGVIEEASDELDQACRVRARRQAVVELLRGVDARSRRTRAELLPVLEALEVGAPELDTGERLRRALAAWEGRL